MNALTIISVAGARSSAEWARRYADSGQWEDAVAERDAERSYWVSAVEGLLAWARLGEQRRAAR